MFNEFTLTYKGRVTDSESARIFYSAHHRKQNKIIKHFLPKIFTAIKNDYISFINAINEMGYEFAKSNISQIVNADSISKVLKRLYIKSAYIESNYVLNYLNNRKKKHPLLGMQLKKVAPHFGIGFDDLSSVIDSYFQIRLISDSAIPITETTKKEILRWLVQEVDNGKSIEQAILDFKDLAITGLKPKAMMRARRIAISETTKAMSFGGMIGAYMSGVDCEKVWVTSDDERVRGLPNYHAEFPHTNLDLNVSSIFGEFNNGEPIKYPGDPDANVSNIANCRCAMYFREKPKPKPVVKRSIGNFLYDFLSGVINAVINQFN